MILLIHVNFGLLFLEPPGIILTTSVGLMLESSSVKLAAQSKLTVASADPGVDLVYTR